MKLSQQFSQFIRPNDFKDTTWWLRNTKLLSRRYYLMNMLLTLLTLIAIFFIDRTLGKALDSQRNNKDIFRKDLRGMQSVKEMLSSDRANFYTNPQKTGTNDTSTFDRFSVFVPNDVSAFIQISVTNDIPATTTSSFKQLNVPTIATLIDLWTCDNSLSFHFNTITATSTAKLTLISATTTAQMNSSIFESSDTRNKTLSALRWRQLINVLVYIRQVTTTRRDRTKSTNNMTNTITMVLEPLAPPAAWIWWIHASQGLGCLPHIFSNAPVEAI